MRMYIPQSTYIPRVTQCLSPRLNWAPPPPAPLPQASKHFSTSNKRLKGQCHEIFDFCFFSRISFPQAPEYTIRVVSNFFENSRRYSQLKVCHRCQRHRRQMQKIFNYKSLNYLVWTPLGSIVNL